jgi:hypothetical protein
MMIIVAIAGYVLFLFVVILYRVGNRLNVQETQALALHSLVLTLCDDARDGIRRETEAFILEKCQQTSTRDVAWGLMLTVTQTAKKLHADNPSDSVPVDSLNVLIAIIEDMKQKRNA